MSVTLGVTLLIKNFRHRGLRRLFEHGSGRGIAPDHSARLARILDRLDAAAEIRDMRYPGSGLHPLRGGRAGSWAVRVSGNWRVVFRFEAGDAYDVDYVDYH